MIIIKNFLLISSISTSELVCLDDSIAFYQILLEIYLSFRYWTMFLYFYLGDHHLLWHQLQQLLSFSSFFSLLLPFLLLFWLLLLGLPNFFHFLFYFLLLFINTHSHSKQKASNSLNLIFSFPKVLNRALRISFSQFFSTHTLNQRQMNPFRWFYFKNSIQINMFISISQPFLSPHNMCNLHLPIINNISQMKSRPSITSHYHKIIKLLER